MLGASGADEPAPIGIAIGIKTGLIPPVLATPELVVHGPHFLLGAFGIVTSDQLTLGGELGCEFAPPGKNTFYLLGSYFHYSRNGTSGFYERSDAMTLTSGYEWKGRHVELQLGGGALFILADDVSPCTFCFKGLLPTVLPTFDLAVRYRF